MGQKLVTEEVMDWCLDQGIQLPKVNFLHRLPAELREMVYAYVIPTGTEIIRFKGTLRDDRQCRNLMWQEYLNMMLVCRMVSTEVLSFVLQRCKFALQLATQYIKPWSPVDKGSTSFREALQAAVKMLPEWLLTEIDNIKMFSLVDEQEIDPKELLGPLLNDIRLNLRPQAETEVVQFATTPENVSGSLFSAHLSAFPSLKIVLTFRNSCRCMMNIWTPREQHNVSALPGSLALNVNGYRSHVEIDRSTSELVYDGFFYGEERLAVDDEGWLELDARSG